MIVNSELEDVPLVRTRGVFASAVARLDVAFVVFVHFTSAVMVLNRRLRRKVGYRISVMGDSVLLTVVLFVGEGVVGVVADSRLSEVDHGGGDVVSK